MLDTAPQTRVNWVYEQLKQAIVSGALPPGTRLVAAELAQRWALSPTPLREAFQRLEAEADELWRFVEKKANRQWFWIALEAQTRQVLAFHVGDRSRQSAAALWQKIPARYREQATFYTDRYEVYKGVIPPAQHRAITKLARKTNPVERLNCTLRQRVSRLVRATLSFAKKLANHLGAIKYFLCHYNLTRAAALPG